MELSPKSTARLGGVFYLIIIVAGIFAEIFVRQQLIVYQNPVSTAKNILANESLYRLGFSAHVLVVICALILLIILFNILKHVNKNLALLMVFFNLISLGIESVSLLCHYEPLLILKGGTQFNSISEQQLQELAYIPISLQSVGYDLGLLFFGFVCVLLGYLIYYSTFLPRIIGILMILAGFCYILNSFTHFLVPQFSSYLFPYILFPSFVGELVLTLWLIIKGINVQSWTEIVQLNKMEF